MVCSESCRLLAGCANYPGVAGDVGRMVDLRRTAYAQVVTSPLLPVFSITIKGKSQHGLTKIN